MTEKRTKTSIVTPVKANEKELLDAELAGETHEELGSEVEELLGIPQVFLTDAQWDALNKWTRLSSQIRVEINLALRRYWHTVTNQRIAPDTLTQIGDARKTLSALTSSLLQLSDNPDLFKRQIIYFDRSAIEQRKILLETCSQLDRADDILSIAEERLNTKPEGPPFAAVYELIHRLDWVLSSHLGIALTRSNNQHIGQLNTRDFVIEVVKAADLKIKDSTIDTVIRDYISDRNAASD